MEPGARISRAAALEWIAGMFEEPVEAIREDTPRDSIVAWDSLGMLTLMAGFDEKFDVRLTEAETPMLKSVSDILEVLRKNGRLSDD